MGYNEIRNAKFNLDVSSFQVEATDRRQASCLVVEFDKLDFQLPMS